eukprot:429068-Pleurochrysis_carterae.AAC.1
MHTNAFRNSHGCELRVRSWSCQRGLENLDLTLKWRQREGHRLEVNHLAHGMLEYGIDRGADMDMDNRNLNI